MFGWVLIPLGGVRIKHPAIAFQESVGNDPLAFRGRLGRQELGEPSLVWFGKGLRRPQPRLGFAFADDGIKAYFAPVARQFNADDDELAPVGVFGWPKALPVWRTHPDFKHGDGGQSVFSGAKQTEIFDEFILGGRIGQMWGNYGGRFFPATTYKGGGQASVPPKRLVKFDAETGAEAFDGQFFFDVEFFHLF